MATKLLRNPLTRGLHSAEERLDPTGSKGWRSKGNDPFYGNAATQAGNVGEGKVQRAFMSEIQQYGEKHGGDFKGAQFREGIFETNDKYAGMGASPDGRLFDVEGNSLGVVEFKFLGSKSAGKALKTYTDQMQMQMMIADEQYATLAVLDTETGEYSQHTIEADLDHQERLFEASLISQSISSQVTDVVGIRDMRAVIAQQKTGNRSSQTSAANEVSGNEARFEFIGPQPEGVMPVFQEGDTDIDMGSVASAAGKARQLKYDKKNGAEQESEILRSHKQAIKHQRKLDLDAKNAPIQAAQAAKNKVMKGVEEEAMGANLEKNAEKLEADREALAIRKELNTAQGQALQEERQRQVEINNSKGVFGQFKKQMKDSAFVIGIFTDAMKDLVDQQRGGIETSQSYKTLGLEAGTTTEAAASIAQEYERGGGTEQQAFRAVQAVGNVVQQLQQPESRNAYFAPMNARLSLNPRLHAAKASLTNGYLASMPSVGEFANKIAVLSKDMDPATRIDFYSAVGVPEAKFYDPNGNASNVDEFLLDRVDVPESSAAHGMRATVLQTQKDLQMKLLKDEVDDADVTANAIIGGKVALWDIKGGLRSAQGLGADLVASLASVGSDTYAYTSSSDVGAALSTSLVDMLMNDGEKPSNLWDSMKQVGRYSIAGGALPNNSIGNVPNPEGTAKEGKENMTFVLNQTVIGEVEQEAEDDGNLEVFDTEVTR